jgi:hypothetical protein
MTAGSTGQDLGIPEAGIRGRLARAEKPPAQAGPLAGRVRWQCRSQRWAAAPEDVLLVNHFQGILLARRTVPGQHNMRIAAVAYAAQQLKVGK